jgi:hypothetical protein
MQAISLPPARVAAVTANAAEPQVSKQNEIGLDLGRGATVEAVRQRWAAARTACRAVKFDGERIAQQ